MGWFQRKRPDDSEVDGEEKQASSVEGGCGDHCGPSDCGGGSHCGGHGGECNSQEGEPEGTELEAETADEYFTRGVIHLKSGQLDHALADFNEVIRQEPDDPEGYSHRAMVYLQMEGASAEALANALADAEEAVRLDPDEAEFREVRGVAYVSNQIYAEAINDLSYFISEEDGSRAMGRIVEAFYFRGLAWSGLEEWKKAIADFTRAIGRTPNFSAAYAARGYAYERLGKTKKANADREQALRRSS